MRYFECRIKINDINSAILLELSSMGKIDFSHYLELGGYYILDLTTNEIDLLKRRGVTVQKGEDLDELAKLRKTERARIGSDDDIDDALISGFVDRYFDAAQVYQRIESLSTEYPGLCELTVLPYATNGYDGSNPELSGPSEVLLLRITNTVLDHSKPGLLLICGTHAREWVNPLIAIEFAEQILRNYDPTSSDPEVITINRIVEEGDIFIVPVMNPDGLNYSFHDSAGWRKNRTPNPAEPTCPGVDNNRNYEIYFGDAGSSSDACSNVYRGTAIFSEPENQNIRYILEQYPNILIGVDSHSRGEKIFRPNPAGGTYIGSLPVFAEDEMIYQELEAAAIAAIQAVNGKTYLTGTTSNHAGTSDEYMFFVHRIFGFDFECAQQFQPPIDDALVSVQEITAALRVLALKAIDLEVAAPSPVSIVQCIDRTGSMVTFGYVDSARSNARRFVDLMSIQDNTAVVSFADPSPDPDATPFDDRAIVEFPLTEINDPGDYAAVRQSINDIAFGGWTSIGAGLQKSVELCETSELPRAIILISDGFENRAPWTADVLSTFPEDIPVYTVALGDLADVILLQDIASATGGQFYMGPTSLDLHEIYNQIRSDVSDDGLVLNRIISAENDDSETFYHADVEQGAVRLTVSLSWEMSGMEPDILIYDPYGKMVCLSDWGVKIVRDDKYVLVKKERPSPGRWQIYVQNLSSKAVLAAFVKSQINAELKAVMELTNGDLVGSIFIDANIGMQFVYRLKGTASLKSIRLFQNQSQLPLKRSQLEWIDILPENVGVISKPMQSENKLHIVKELSPIVPIGYPLQMRECHSTIIQQQKKRESDQKGPIANKTGSSIPSPLKDKLNGTNVMSHKDLYQFRFSNTNIPGIYNIRLKVDAEVSEDIRFRRVALVTFQAGTM